MKCEVCGTSCPLMVSFCPPYDTLCPTCANRWRTSADAADIDVDQDETEVLIKHFREHPLKAGA